MGKDLPEGYYVPLHRSLTEPVLIAGVPRDFFFMNWSAGIAITISFTIYPFLIITFILHALMIYVTKKDPQYFGALRRHINDKKYFDV